MLQKLKFPKAIMLICKKRSWSSKSYGNALRTIVGVTPDGVAQYINFPTATISLAATEGRNFQHILEGVGGLTGGMKKIFESPPPGVVYIPFV